MTDFDRYVRQIFFISLSLVLLFAGISLLLGHKPWARGAVLGGAASLVNLLIMAGDVRRHGAEVDTRGGRPTFGRYALRMGTIAAVLIYAAINENMALWATIPALFASQVVMTGTELLGGREQEPS